METRNTVESMKESRALFTPKKIISILSIICIVFVFCPAFLVSCSDETAEIDLMTAVTGIESDGMTFVEPHPVMLLCLLIPIAILVMLITEKIEKQKIAKITLAAMLLDFVMWLSFKVKAKEIAEEYYCGIETTKWFYMNIISIALIIVLAFLIVIKVLQMDTNLHKLLSGEGRQDVINKMNSAVNQMTSTVNKMTTAAKDNKENVIGYCSKCGSGLVSGSRFCKSCGAPISGDILAEKEENKTEENQEKTE